VLPNTTLKGKYVFREIVDEETRVQALQIYVLSGRGKELSPDDGDTIELMDIAIEG
jgi:hypothetical protein